MATLPILKVGCCWSVRDGSTIKAQSDKWLPNNPTNKILHSVNEDVEDWLVPDLIDPEIHWWRRELITAIFYREDAEAICRIPLSRRRVADSIIWMHAKNGGYSVRTGYHVARRVFKHEDLAESSGGSDMQRECPAAQDIWAGSRIKIQKRHLGQPDMLQLFLYLLDILDMEDVELIWRAVEYLEEFKQVQVHLTIPPSQAEGNVWRPPSQSLFKLNFDAEIFRESNSSGFGAVIRNEQGEVMAAMAAKGPLMLSNEEAETLACKKALEFAVDVGFSELVVEGDNVNVMKAIFSSSMNLSLLGNVIADI
ncbi:uncharacterized protein LOC142609091 [Castanea sativa]|uniref:uncharacterized protein LOC142609091 n=1 Tax=Castanea sativa TaxID=21020 RepID=UPI003F64B814